MPMAQLQQEHLHMNFHEKVNEYMNRAVNKKASDYIWLKMLHNFILIIFEYKSFIINFLCNKSIFTKFIFTIFTRKTSWVVKA